METDWLEKHLNDEATRIVESNEDILLYDTGHIPGALGTSNLYNPIDRTYQPRTFAKMSGATMVASDSIMYFGVSTLNLPQVIFSLGTAPEYDPKLVVESLIWQK